MIHENVELHNVAEVKNYCWGGFQMQGFQMQRVPEEVRTRLNAGAQERCLSSANSEIRFVCDTPKARVTLSSPTGEDVFFVMHGTFLNPVPFPLTESKITIQIERSELLAQLKPGHALAFDPGVFRLLLPRRPILFYGAEGVNLRPPTPTQVPTRRYLAYGTSITEGGCATRPHLSYVAQTARRLGLDLINLGMSGTCQCEKEMADYIAQRTDWDIASLCLSVNMLAFTPEEFARRVRYTVHTIAGANPRRPVACITMFPFFIGLSTQHFAEEEKTERFRQILREAVADCPHKNACLIEGPELLDDADGLTSDMLHPSDYGMHRIAENLAARLRTLLPR